MYKDEVYFFKANGSVGLLFRTLDDMKQNNRARAVRRDKLVKVVQKDTVPPEEEPEDLLLKLSALDLSESDSSLPVLGDDDKKKVLELANKKNIVFGLPQLETICS